MTQTATRSTTTHSFHNTVRNRLKHTLLYYLVISEHNCQYLGITFNEYHNCVIEINKIVQTTETTPTKIKALLIDRPVSYTHLRHVKTTRHCVDFC